MNILVALAVYTLIAAISPALLRGVRVRTPGTAFLVAIVFGIVNVLLGWLLSLVVTVITFPIMCCTFGLFGVVVSVIVNTLLIKLVAALVTNFELDGWWPAFGMGALFAIAHWLLS